MCKFSILEVVVIILLVEVKVIMTAGWSWMVGRWLPRQDEVSMNNLMVKDSDTST